MKKIVLYDKETGRLKGRMMCLDDVLEHLKEPYVEIGNGVTEEEWDLQAELWWKLDLETKQLIDLTEDELKTARPPGGLPMAKPDMKARGRE